MIDTIQPMFFRNIFLTGYFLFGAGCLVWSNIHQEQIAYLLHRDLFQSSFNQLFHLGRADNSLFEMIYDDYPHARIFRLQSQ